MECGVPLVVDLDDDEATLGVIGGGADADAVERLLQGRRRPGHRADARLRHRRCRSRAGRHSGAVVPNVVSVPPPGQPGQPGQALYVANFDYAPNRQSARWLLDEVLPHVTALRELAIVGPFSQQLMVASSAAPLVVAHGKVPHLDPYYAAASVVLCPVLAGSGTSIKVIEALAHGRAVVTTTVGARGLGLVHGEHAMITDDPHEFAAVVSRLSAVPAEAAALGARGRALVAERYSVAAGDAAMVASVLAALR
jgi:glycosyltransferase involved in cell wall biosynthesis